MSVALSEEIKSILERLKKRGINELRLYMPLERSHLSVVALDNALRSIYAAASPTSFTEQSSTSESGYDPTKAAAALMDAALLAQAAVSALLNEAQSILDVVKSVETPLKRDIKACLENPASCPNTVAAAVATIIRESEARSEPAIHPSLYSYLGLPVPINWVAMEVAQLYGHMTNPAEDTAQATQGDVVAEALTKAFTESGSATQGDVVSTAGTTSFAESGQATMGDVVAEAPTQSFLDGGYV